MGGREQAAGGRRDRRDRRRATAPETRPARSGGNAILREQKRIGSLSQTGPLNTQTKERINPS
jgi:hypothetical protein